MNGRRRGRSGVGKVAAFSIPRRFISRLQLIVGVVAMVLSPGSIPRVTELPKGREERRRGLRSDPSSLLLRGVESSRRRCLAINYREGLLPPSSFPPLPPPSLFLSLSSPAPETDRPSDRSIRHSLRRHRWTVAAPDNNGVGGRERKKGRGREGGRGKTAL